MSPINFVNTSIQKQYQNYLIKLSSDLDIIKILIEKEIIQFMNLILI